MSQDVDVFVLNYNGRRLLQQCLPSVVRACRQSRSQARLTVVDNSSGDDSLAYLRQSFPDVAVQVRPNRGLCSFNDALADSNAAAAVLLNNDIAVADDFVDRLLEPLLAPHDAAAARPCFLTAALCWKMADGDYDGQKTAVAWRWGLVQATSLFPGHEPGVLQAGRTASAGAAIAVDRRAFLKLGGFDPLYLPGRLEDLDLAYRAFLAGYECRYVPSAVCRHIGMASFEPLFGATGAQHLALRNTLLFQWKHLRHPRHRLRQTLGFAARLARDAVRAPWQTADRRWEFVRAWREARAVFAQHGRPCETSNVPNRHHAERQFFAEFHPRRLCAAVGGEA